MAVPKFLGADCELSTTGINAKDEGISSWDVTRAVLRCIGAAYVPLGTAVWTESQGIGGSSTGRSWVSPYSQDCLRHWAPDGKCYYADRAHVETCAAEALLPTAFGAQILGTLRVAEAARKQAEEKDDGGAKFFLSASNVDARQPEVSWGSHVNVTVERDLWENLFVDHRHPGVLGFVASALAAAIPFFGAGYLLPMNDGTFVYSLSARAHHISKIVSSATTEAFGRGILNSRREAHARDVERLHLIGFDNAVLSSPLLATYLQCVLAAAEEGFGGLNLQAPLRALRGWSWRMDLDTGRHPAMEAMTDGELVSFPGYVREVASTLLRMREGGLIREDVAPEADVLLPKILDLTHYVEEGSVIQCARHLTWAAKLLTLLDLASREGASLGDPVTRLADHDFLNTDPDRGVFWRLWNDGHVDPLVDRSDVDAALRDGPPESRAWCRGRILQRFGDRVKEVNWDHVTLRRDAERWSPRLKISMPAPGSPTRALFEPILEQADTVLELERILEERASSSASQEDPVENIVPQLAVRQETRDSMEPKERES